MAAPVGPKKVHRYTLEFKIQAVRLANHPEIQTQDVAKALDIHPFMLSKWKKDYREGNRPRNCQDNAHMESFFHSLKAELTHRRSFASDAELNASIAGYINRFYNEKRIHSSLGYHSPVEFECLANA